MRIVTGQALRGYRTLDVAKPEGLGLRAIVENRKRKEELSTSTDQRAGRLGHWWPRDE